VITVPEAENSKACRPAGIRHSGTSPVDVIRTVAVSPVASAIWEAMVRFQMRS